jgi:hypothetical protein
MLRYGREGEEAWITESGCLSPAPSICPEQAYTIAARSLAYYDGDGRLWLNHEPLPAAPMTVYKRWFPIIGYASDVIPPRPAATPPGGYP